MIEPSILYSFRRCPYAMRARMAVLISGELCAIREVSLRDKPMEMLAVSPKATVPAPMLSNGAVIDESLDIMGWSLRRHDPENWIASWRACSFCFDAQKMPELSLSTGHLSGR